MKVTLLAARYSLGNDERIAPCPRQLEVHPIRGSDALAGSDALHRNTGTDEGVIESGIKVEFRLVELFAAPDEVKAVVSLAFIDMRDSHADRCRPELQSVRGDGELVAYLDCNSGGPVRLVELPGAESIGIMAVLRDIVGNIVGPCPCG